MKALMLSKSRFFNRRRQSNVESDSDRRWIRIRRSQRGRDAVGERVSALSSRTMYAKFEPVVQIYTSGLTGAECPIGKACRRRSNPRPGATTAEIQKVDVKIWRRLRRRSKRDSSGPKTQRPIVTIGDEKASLLPRRRPKREICSVGTRKDYQSAHRR